MPSDSPQSAVPSSQCLHFASFPVRFDQEVPKLHHDVPHGVKKQFTILMPNGNDPYVPYSFDYYVVVFVKDDEIIMPIIKSMIMKQNIN